MTSVRSLLAALVLLLGACAAQAHEVRPAYLEISQTGPERYDVFWKQPAQGDRALHLVPHLSNGWLERRAPVITVEPTHISERWTVDDARGPDGARLYVEGLDASITDVLVHASLADGRAFETILHPAQPSAVIGFAHAGGLAVPAYFRLGVMHILTGIDHLCFVLGLLMLVGLRPQLLKAITAFTVAHSLTLAASALGLVRAPPATIEALVALSVLALAVELARGRRGVRGFSHRQPWVVAFSFGLLHGFAFAGALRETGLPPHAIPQALLFFNLGVEAGQLIFVGAIAAIVVAVRMLAPRLRLTGISRAQAIAEYGLGVFSAYWLIERTALVFSI